MHIEASIRSYRKSKGYKTKEFSRLIGISQGSLSEIQTAKNAPSADTLASLVRTMDINPTWLLTGEGEMLVSDAPQSATCPLQPGQRLPPRVCDYMPKTLEVLTNRYPSTIEALENPSTTSTTMYAFEDWPAKYRMILISWGNRKPERGGPSRIRSKEGNVIHLKF